ncbi:NrfD/PsrC family molybdoenzyme membrane anchor subunit [Sciscionella marina]|uniref:NrfD/PsrC family molybdoenzyme membrane anchor subunit n=1 Tax=Sciscionella marina TaxID=508770 RepID=UPI000376EA7B|nr:NrfD/PsrC family molybdoenzyme membrane anchor subunit [Sciscionella marina]
MSHTDAAGNRARTGRNAVTGGRRHRRKHGEQPMVPDAEFGSYYGLPVLNAPVWKTPDVPGYLFLGGLAGAGSLLGAGAALTRRPTLQRITTTGSIGSALVSLAALVHDLGRPARFLNMLRVFKPSSPMSVGSWLLSAYAPAAGVAAVWAHREGLVRVAAVSSVLERFPTITRIAGTGATAAAAVTGPAVAAYTAALLSDTAVPAWHDGYRELPFVFIGSGAAAAGGLGLFAPTTESVPARVFAVLGAGCELFAFERMRSRLGMVGEPYDTGPGGMYLKASKALAVCGAAGAVLGRRSRVISALSGAALFAASAATRWGVFHAGLTSAKDPKYTVVPQRERLNQRRTRQ